MINKLAITDLEFTGFDPFLHEIIDFGVILADIETLDEIARYEAKVKPERIETGAPDSLAYAGYSEEAWREASPIKEVLEKYSQFVEGAIFASWTYLDWVFIREAYKKSGLPSPIGYHAVDIFTVAFEKLRKDFPVEKLRLKGLAEHFGIPTEPKPHRAINGAEQAFLVYKKLRDFGAPFLK